MRHSGPYPRVLPSTTLPVRLLVDLIGIIVRTRYDQKHCYAVSSTRISEDHSEPELLKMYKYLIVTKSLMDVSPSTITPIHRSLD